MADDGLIQPNAIVEEYTVQARKANASLRKTWDSWIENGRPIHAFEQQLDNEVIPNDPTLRPQDTQRWRDSMGAFLRREGWHESQPTGFTKAERTNLMHILARLDEVQAYRTRFGQTKGEQKLQRHNNPSSVWRAFLKDIGELKTKEGGKKSTLKESVAQLQERVDVLNKENERLSETIAGDAAWVEQITAIVENVKPDDVADAVYGGSGHDEFLGLTNSLVRRYARTLEYSPPASTEDLLVNTRYMEDPKLFIRDNSQQARQYADAILNELDGQIDEPHDDRLAKRIINGRGNAAALRLAQAITALAVQEAVEQVKQRHGSPQGEPPKLPDPILGQIVVLGHYSKSTETCLPKDHPEAGWWYLYCGENRGGRHGSVRWSRVEGYEKGFATLEEAEVAAAAYAAKAQMNDAQEPPKQGRVCSGCGERGHNVRTCPKVTLDEELAENPSLDRREVESDTPRLGAKRVIGKRGVSYFPLTPSDPPGLIERYFLEVYQANDANPEGTWIRIGGEGWATREDAAQFI